MAENESLDLAENTAWYISVRPKIERHEDADALCLQHLLKSLNKSHKQIYAHGVTFSQLLEAAVVGDVPRLRGLVKTCEGHDYARLFVDVSIASPSAHPEALLHDYIEAVLEKYLDQMVNFLGGGISWPQIPELQAHVDQIRSRLDRAIHRLAGNLADEPDRKLRRAPRRPRGDGPTSGDLFGGGPPSSGPPDPTEGMLGLSLRILP